MKKKLNSFWLMLLLTMIPSVIMAQNPTLKGVVVDTEGYPLPGATIVETGNTRNGTISDANGEFTISLTKGRSITLSFVGMLTQTVDVAGKSIISITMQEDAGIALDDLVVIGYGTATRKSLTGAVASVNASTLKDIPVTSALQAISGRMPGVNVTVSDGSPDANIKVLVRGGGSITQDSSPLYIVDGFIVKNINDIPPGDIQSVDVLKDASSTAIYGAQGANGVILLTTKSGRAGRTTVSVNSSVGFKRVYNLTEVLSPYEYVYFQREIDSDPRIANSSFFSMYGRWEDTDLYKKMEGLNWQDDLFGNTGLHMSNSISINGGTDKVKYNVSYTRDDEDYVMLNSGYQRDNINIKLDKKINKRVEVDLTARTTKTVITGPSISDGRMLRDALKYAPVKSLSTLSSEQLMGNEMDSWAEAASLLNDPIYNVVNEYKKQNNLNTSYNMGLSWQIIQGLKYRVQGSYAFESGNTDNIWLKKTGESNSNSGRPVARRTETTGNRWTITNTLNYDFNINKMHQFNLMAGQEIMSSQTDQTLIQATQYPEDFTAKQVLAMWNYGDPQPVYTTIGEPSRTSSFFGRLNYTLKDRYYLTLTAREDGTNVFAPGNQWGFFPAGAAAWRFSEELFMTDTRNWLSNGKLRLSYGLVGNARVGSYWRQDYTFITANNQQYYVNENVQSALKPSTVLKNENLTWETKTSFNVGLDLSFLNDRISVVVDGYNDVTKDLILAVDIPTHSGYNTQYQNLGQTTNRGLEFTMDYHIIKKRDFNLSAGFNISFNRNRIDKLDGLSDQMIVSSGWGMNIGTDDYRALIGKPIGQIWGYKSDGFYTFDDFTFNSETQRWILNDGVADCSSQVISTSGNWFGPGHIKLKKLADDGTNLVTSNDRTVIGNTQPKHTGGFNINMDYKGFDLSALFNWSYGNDIYNANKIDNTFYAGSKRYQNLSNEMNLENRFTTIDPETGYNIFYGEHADPEKLQQLNRNASLWHPLTNATLLTDWAVEDGSFLRLSNLTVGYTLPALFTRKYGVQNLRVYVTGYNLYCWTKYSGQDPEVNTRRSTPLTPGVDYSAYPKARTFLFGINLTL